MSEAACPPLGFTPVRNELICVKYRHQHFGDAGAMKSPPRPPLRHCPLCGIAMQAKRSTAHLPHFDTFECLSCATTIVERPKLPGDSTPGGKTD